MQDCIICKQHAVATSAHTCACRQAANLLLQVGVPVSLAIPLCAFDRVLSDPINSHVSSEWVL
jgi:hypothetical protein